MTEKPTVVRTRKSSPTIRQTIAFNKLAEIIRNKGKRKSITLGKIIREAGFSESVVLHPDRVTKSKGFQSLLDKYLPEDLVLNTHKDLLNACGIQNYVFSGGLSDEDITAVIEKIPGAKLVKIQRGPTNARAYFVTAENRSRKDGVDMAYKLRGSYQAEKVEHGLNAELEAALSRMRHILPKGK